MRQGWSWVEAEKLKPRSGAIFDDPIKSLFLLILRTNAYNLTKAKYLKNNIN